MTSTATQSNYEQEIAAIVRSLPQERGRQVLAFARFMAFETFQTTDFDFPEDEASQDLPSLEEPSEDDARWETLLASNEGQTALDKLADQALVEIHAGNTNSVVFTDDGEIEPGS